MSFRRAITDDFVSSFQDADDRTLRGSFMQLTLSLPPELRTVGVDWDDPRVIAILDRARSLQGEGS